MLGVLHLAVASPPSRALSSLQPNALPALSGAIVDNLAEGLGGDDDGLEYTDDDIDSAKLRSFYGNSSTATESCAATCGGAFPSIIKFEWYPVDDPAYDGTTKQHHKCGLSDNVYQINFLLGVARSLCARLSFPHPWQALLDEHNYGRPLDKSWRWGRYLSNSTVELMVGPGEAHAADGAQLLETNGYRDKGNTLTETYATAARIRKDGGVFAWTMKGPYYWGNRSSRAIERRQHWGSIGKTMQALVPDGCRPTRLPSELVKRTAASVLQAHGVPEGGEYSTLQVRRGDTVDRCNTSVAAVREYMSCAERSTDGNSHGWEHAGDRLLLMTDETDATYLKALLAELRSDPRWAGGVTHLDAAILEALDSADRKDNYLVYAVAKWIEQNGGSSFEMRKCNGTATCGGMNFFMHAVRSQSRIMLSHAPPVSPQEMHDLRVIANSSVVIWHEKRNAGVCLTPKIAVSEILDYVRYSVLGVPVACEYAPERVDGAEDACRAHGATWGSKSRYATDDSPPLKFMSLTSLLKTMDAPNRTLVVPYRDPWTRLLSGYRSKMYGTGPGACSAKEVNADQAAKCFQGSWMPWFSLDKSQNLLSRYLDAATQSGHEDDINEHFLTQSRQCLASAALKQARLRVVPAPLEEPRALNAISDAVAPDRPFVEAVHGAYMHPYMNDASLCRPVAPRVFAQALTYLRPDYEAAQELFGTRFDSYKRLEAASERAGPSLVCANDSTIVF